MLKKKKQDKPCRHMESYIQQTAEGSIRGFAKLYALAHVARCGPCRRFLQSLEELILNLRESREAEDQEAMYRMREMIHKLGESE